MSGIRLEPLSTQHVANEAELGYIVAPEARGHGAATQALRHLTKWGFARGLQRLELRGDADNMASRRVAERCGYTLEGILRSVYSRKGAAVTCSSTRDYRPTSSGAPAAGRDDDSGEAQHST